MGRHGIAVAAIKVERLEAQAQEECISPVFGTRDVAVHRSVVRRHDGASVFDWISKPRDYRPLFLLRREKSRDWPPRELKGQFDLAFRSNGGSRPLFRGGQIRITERENGCSTRLPTLAK